MSGVACIYKPHCEPIISFHVQEYSYARFIYKNTVRLRLYSERKSQTFQAQPKNRFYSINHNIIGFLLGFIWIALVLSRQIVCERRG